MINVNNSIYDRILIEMLSVIVYNITSVFSEYIGEVYQRRKNMDYKLTAKQAEDLILTKLSHNFGVSKMTPQMNIFIRR